MEEGTKGRVSLGPLSCNEERKWKLSPFSRCFRSPLDLCHTSSCTFEGQRTGGGEAIPMHRLASGRTHSDVMFLDVPSDALVNTQVRAQFVRPAVHLCN